MLNDLGGRKFLLSLAVVISASFLVWFGRIADGVYSAVVIATAGAYIAANVLQKKVTNEKTAINP